MSESFWRNFFSTLKSQTAVVVFDQPVAKVLFLGSKTSPGNLGGSDFRNFSIFCHFCQQNLENEIRKKSVSGNDRNEVNLKKIIFLLVMFAL